MYATTQVVQESLKYNYYYMRKLPHKNACKNIVITYFEGEVTSTSLQKCTQQTHKYEKTQFSDELLVLLSNFLDQALRCFNYT